MKPIAICAVVLTLAACSQQEPAEVAEAPSTPPVAEAPPPEPAPELDPGLQGGTDDWQAVANVSDVQRMNDLSAVWDEALTQARNTGHGAEIDRAGAALKPDAALPGRIQPTPGDYACRTYKLGNPAAGNGLAYVAYGAFRCRVELTPGGDLILTKTTGSQRTQGLIYPESDTRGVYVGAQAWGDETAFPAYGANPERDQVGAVERIGEQTWRVVFPRPKQESLLDVLVLQY